MELQRGSQRWVIRVEGDLDRIAAPRLEELVTEALQVEPLDVALDLSAVDFLDAGGVRAIEASQLRCAALGLQLRIDDRAAPLIRRVLGITGMIELLTGGIAEPA